MIKFKVGDKVRVINETNGIHVGEMFTISNFTFFDFIDKYTYTVIEKTASVCPYFYEEELELVDDESCEKIKSNSSVNSINQFKEIFDNLLEVGFTRDEALKIMLNSGNVGKIK